MKKSSPYHLKLGTTTLDCSPGPPQRAYVMGILNVTPDSFSDGGRYTNVDTALHRAEQMFEEGATIIDIGGESTRPGGRTYGTGAAAVAEDQERKRVMPVIEAIMHRFPEACISIDTYKPRVAREALEAGASMINDITGLRLFPEMAEIAATYKVPLAVMHSLGKPGALPHEHRYEHVTEDVLASLSQSVQTAKAAGVEHIVIDPGFGFGKTPGENLKLINELHQFAALGCPILIGVSRKSTIGIVLGSQEEPAPVDQRLFGSLGTTAIGVMHGATIVRTHDVRPTFELLKAIEATTSPHN